VKISATTVTALAGGIGAAKLLLGLCRVLPPGNITAIVNTGDDAEIHGLTICPDLDTVTYTLAGVVNSSTGWGLASDTFEALPWLRRYGRETWFNLGDRDLATHIHRTALLQGGTSLSEATENIRRALGVGARILPMSDTPVRTILETDIGRLAFQEYFVRERSLPPVREIHFEGASDATAAPGVLAAIQGSDVVMICPSNPLISIGPILGVPGTRGALAARREHVVAVTPIVGGRSLKGPTGKMLQELGMEVSALAVARMYQDVAGTFVLDETDVGLRAPIKALGIRVILGPTIMETEQQKQHLAEIILAALPWLA
jgi:LPPG:FO 2-phospho-L-lactate transferase